MALAIKYHVLKEIEIQRHICIIDINKRFSNFIKIYQSKIILNTIEILNLNTII